MGIKPPAQICFQRGRIRCTVLSSRKNAFTVIFNPSGAYRKFIKARESRSHTISCLRKHAERDGADERPTFSRLHGLGLLFT